jgi:hypothetical protein
MLYVADSNGTHGWVQQSLSLLSYKDVKESNPTTVEEGLPYSK